MIGLRGVLWLLLTILDYKKELKAIESWNEKDETWRMHLDEVNIVQSSALLQFVFFFSVTERVVASET